MKPGLIKRAGSFLKGLLQRVKRLLGPAALVLSVGHVATSDNPAEAAQEEVWVAVSSATGGAIGTFIFPGPGTLVGQIIGGVFVPMFWTPAETPAGNEVIPVRPVEEPIQPPSPPLPVPTPQSPSPTPAPTPGPSDTKGFGVFILTNVSGGSIWVGEEKHLKNRAVGSFPGGGNCSRLEKGCPAVEYHVKLGPFASVEGANKAYCDNFKRTYRLPLCPGLKAEMSFGDYWIASAPKCN